MLQTSYKTIRGSCDKISTKSSASCWRPRSKPRPAAAHRRASGLAASVAGANPTRSQPLRQGCGAPCVIKPLELQKSVLQGFASICLCLTVCTSGLMGNDTELKSLFGIVFQLRVHRLPGPHMAPRPPVLLLPPIDPCAQENTHIPIVSNCCYTTKFLWPLIYVYQPACGDSKWGYVKLMASKTCCSLD